jgi:PIN domain nuclease of toxin-antitoxin system
VKLLLDTCTFLWLAEGSRTLPAPVIKAFQSADNEVYLSVASAWEIGFKYARRKIELAERPERLVPAERGAHGIAPLPIDEESALLAARLPLIHRDPFDRFLVGQAIVHGMTIATPDRLIAQYAVRTLW